MDDHLCEAVHDIHEHVIVLTCVLCNLLACIQEQHLCLPKTIIQLSNNIKALQNQFLRKKRLETFHMESLK